MLPLLLRSQAKADAEKEQGNAHYKKKELQKALECYTRAIEIFPKEPSYYTNRAAAHFEMGDLGACVADCDQAIEVARAARGDPGALKMVARGMTRKATCLMRQGDVDAVIELYNKALVSGGVAGWVIKLYDHASVGEGRMDLAVAGWVSQAFWCVFGMIPLSLTTRTALLSHMAA